MKLEIPKTSTSSAQHKVEIIKRILMYKSPAKTSRNTLLEKAVFYIKITNTEKHITGIGECSIIPKLSKDDVAENIYLAKLNEVKDAIESNQKEIELNDFPSIKFGLETAILDLKNGGIKKIFDTDFYNGKMTISTNGLVWMNDIETMLTEADSKVDEGYDCIKFKIGAHDFDAEMKMLETFRKKYTASKIAIRLDANCAFGLDDALEKLHDIKRFDVHSIEQPIAVNNWDMMEKLCAESKVPIALDEELIHVNVFENGYELLAAIWPQYLVLKPGLLGGFEVCNEWIRLCERTGVKYWITSALESNIGLNAIAQYTSQFHLKIPQGLGTGSLYTNNIESPLLIQNAELHYLGHRNWGNI